MPDHIELTECFYKHFRSTFAYLSISYKLLITSGRRRFAPKGLDRKRKASLFPSEGRSTFGVHVLFDPVPILFGDIEAVEEVTYERTKICKLKKKYHSLLNIICFVDMCFKVETTSS